MPLQQQKKNGLDCDKSTSLAIGKDSSSSTYHLAALRPHLIKFVTSEKIVPSSEAQINYSYCRKILLICRTPWTTQRQWYHKQCEKITLFFVKNRKHGFAMNAKTEMQRKYDYSLF